MSLRSVMLSLCLRFHAADTTVHINLVQLRHCLVVFVGRLQMKGSLFPLSFFLVTEDVIQLLEWRTVASIFL